MKSFPRLSKGFAALVISGALLSSCQQAPQKDNNVSETTGVTETDWLYEDMPFDMPEVKAPVFPDHEVNLTDFGGKGDGVTLNTQAFSKAISALSEKGGGTLYISRGVWLTGPIVLQSNINIHTEKGALVVFSDDKSLYPVVAVPFEGLETYRCQSPISAKNVENIAFTGSGVFDGNGQAWRPVKKSKMAPAQWSKLVKSGGVLSEDKRIWYPSQQYKTADGDGNFNVPDLESKEDFNQIKDYLRPVMVSLVSCKNVLLDGPTFQNSPAWNIHPLMCENVIIRNLSVRNPWYSQNGDGLDLESCKNVLIYNNTFDVGDDAICFKSGKDEDGRKRGMATENVIVANNVVYHGHGGFVIGSEMSGGVKNVKVTHCTFMGTDVGLRFKSTRGRGGVVENIFISNIDMINIPTEAIRFNMFYGGNSPILEEDQNADTEAPDEEMVAVTEETPSFRNIYMKDIRVSGSYTAAKLQGLPEMKLQNVHLENAQLQAKNGITMIDAEGITLKNVQIAQEQGAALTVYNTQKVNAAQLAFKNADENQVRVLGASADIDLAEAGADKAKVMVAETAKGAVKW